MGKTADSRGLGVRPDPVRSFNRWKKKHSYRQSQKKQLRKQLKKPEWQVEREVINRLVQNYEKVSPEGGGVRGGPRGRARHGVVRQMRGAACPCGAGLHRGLCQGSC